MEVLHVSCYVFLFSIVLMFCGFLLSFRSSKVVVLESLIRGLALGGWTVPSGMCAPGSTGWYWTAT